MVLNRIPSITRLEPRYVAGVLIALGLLAYPFIGTVYYTFLVTSAAFVAIFAVTYDFFSGLTGYFSFSHMVFVGLGAYTSAIVASEMGISPFITIPAAGIFTAAFAIVLFGLTSLRLSDLYFTILTIAVASISVRLITLFGDTTGGQSGYTELIPITPKVAEILPMSLTEVQLNYYIAVGMLLVITTILLILAKSKLGTILGLMTQDEVLLRTIGIDPGKYRLGAFGVSAFLAGLTGATYAHVSNILNPQSHLSLSVMLDLVIASIVGGIGTLIGPILGVGFLFGIEEVLYILEYDMGLAEGTDLTAFRRLITMVLVLAFLYLAPEGVYPKCKRFLGKLIPSRFREAKTDEGPMKEIEE